MDFHPIANIFPLLEGKDLEAMVDDIRQHGQRNDIVLYEGKILDGRNRWTACTLAGVKQRTREFAGTRTEALAFVWSENMIHRHLTPSQAAVAEHKREKLSAEYAAEMEKSKAEAEQERRERISKSRRGETVEKVPPSEKENRLIDAQRAKAAGTNRSYLEQVRKIDKLAPEALDAIERGEKSVRQAYLEVTGKPSQKQIGGDTVTTWKTKTVSRFWCEQVTQATVELDALTKQSLVKYSKIEVRRVVDALLSLVSKLS